MSKVEKAALLVGLSLVLAACEVFDDDHNNAVSDPAPPAAATYNVTIESVDMINVDSGQTIQVEGFPVRGGMLTVE